MNQKLISIMLIVCMLFSILPISAFAENEESVVNSLVMIEYQNGTTELWDGKTDINITTSACVIISAAFKQNNTMTISGENVSVDITGIPGMMI